MASLSADNVAQLVQAVTDAAKAASEAVMALKEQQAARTGLNDGFKEASKVIRQPWVRSSQRGLRTVAGLQYEFPCLALLWQQAL